MEKSGPKDGFSGVGHLDDILTTAATQPLQTQETTPFSVVTSRPDYGDPLLAGVQPRLCASNERAQQRHSEAPRLSASTAHGAWLSAMGEPGRLCLRDSPASLGSFFLGCLKSPQQPTDVEYARILVFAFRVCKEKLHEYLETTEATVLIKLVAPSLVTFVKSFGEDCPAEITEIVRSIITQLRTRMPRASSWDMSHIRLHGGRTCCKHCTELQMFLSSPHRRTLRSTMSKQLRHHVHKVIEAYCGSLLTHITDRPSTLVMTKQLPAVDLHDVAQNAIRSLSKLVGDISDPGVLPLPTPLAQEVIEIDSD